MQVRKNTVVTLNYRVTDSDTNIVDDGQNPKAATVGEGIADEVQGECQEFRVRACIMGTKEMTHGTTERADYPG